MGATVAGAGGMCAGGGSGAGEGGTLRQQPPMLLPRGTHVLHRRAFAQIPRYVHPWFEHEVIVVHQVWFRYVYPCKGLEVLKQISDAALFLHFVFCSVATSFELNHKINQKRKVIISEPIRPSWF